MNWPTTVRAELLLAAWFACAASQAVAGTVPPAQASTPTPTALTTAATMSVRAQRAAVLALARAGDRLVAAGERGTVLLSDDAGRNWRQATVPVRASLTALQFVDARRGWAVGHFGVVLHTTDGGETWVRQLDGQQAARLAQAAATTPEARKAAEQLVQDGPDKPLLALHFSSPEQGLVVGAYNLALRTTDGGRSWQYVGHELPNPRRMHLYGIAVQGRQLVIAGEQGLLMASDDAGERFRAVESPYLGSYFGVVGAGSGAWLAFGLRGTAYRAELGGTGAPAWQKTELPTPASVAAGLMLADGRLLLASQAGELLVSDDQGRRFTRLPGPPLPVASLAQAADGGLVLGTLRGPVPLPLPR